MSAPTQQIVEAKLRKNLEASVVNVEDTSGGCGASFELVVVSDKFEGKRLLERHRMVNAALSDEMRYIHALSIKKAMTVKQWEDSQ